MRFITNTLPNMTLVACLGLALAACLPERAQDRLAENNEHADGHDETSDKQTDNPVHSSSPLNLPATPFDYATYADDDLPAHFRTDANGGSDNTVDSDNTPANNPVTNAGATLGRVLFYDKSLSINDAVSCASCHKQSLGFSDVAVLSEGFQGGLMARHSMSLANNRFYQSGKFFWDERANTLEEQVLMPIQDGVEMGMDLETLIIKLVQLDYYPALFNDAFGSEDITSERISLALAQFNRAMVSYQSQYDAALASATDANLQGNNLSHVLNADEEAGRLLFENAPPQGGG